MNLLTSAGGISCEHTHVFISRHGASGVSSVCWKRSSVCSLLLLKTCGMLMQSLSVCVFLFLKVLITWFRGTTAAIYKNIQRTTLWRSILDKRTSKQAKSCLQTAKRGQNAWGVCQQASQKISHSIQKNADRLWACTTEQHRQTLGTSLVAWKQTEVVQGHLGWSPLKQD